MNQDCHQKLKAGSYYHIYNRGNNKETIFKDTANYHYFLRLWWKYTTPIAITYCYSLLPNHFHFFIRMMDDADEKLASKALSNLFNAYAKTINKTYQRTGSLFQERFKRKEIINDHYFTKIIFYILTNATKHGIVKNALHYEHSAYSQLISDEPTFLMREEVIKWFNGKENFISQLEIYDRNLTTC